MKYIYNFIKSNSGKMLFSLLTTAVIFSSYRAIAQPLSGNYNVGTGQTYTTITAAIADLASKGVNAPVTFTLMDASYTSGETFPITINGYTNASATNTVTIRPSSTSSVVVVSSANAAATFDFNGVSYFTIDGRPGATGSTGVLQIINTSSSGVAIRMINDATNNTINYADVQGQNTVSIPAITTAAGVIFINSANSTNLVGNDNNTISNCKVHGTGTTTSNFPTIGICAYGTQTTTGSYNDNCTINNCNVYDVYNSSLASEHVKIDLGNTGWNITNNHFYQTITIDYQTSAATYRALWVTPNVSNINNAANNFLISGNFIGGNNAAGTGTYTMTGSSTFQYWAMDLSVGLGTATSVQNNTITNIDMTTSNGASRAMEGIEIANGNVNIGTVTGNLIGSTTSNPGITFTANANTGGPIAIRAGGGTNNVINISNNTIAGFVLNAPTSVAAIFNGINAAGGTTVNITNNIIGSTTVANSINAPAASTSASLQSLRGIVVNGTGTTGVVNGNTIANMNTNSVATGTQANSLVGIYIGSTGGSGVPGAYTVSGNTIMNLSSSGQTTSGGSTVPLIGIAFVTNTAPAVISGNIIHTFKLTNTSNASASNLTGIYYNGPSGTTNSIEKNFIHSLSIASPSSTGSVKGLDIAAGGLTIKNNMIRLGVEEDGANYTKPVSLYGISEDGGTNNIYYNSIYIGGDSVTTGSVNTYAFASAVSSASREIKNNIFSNVRSNYTSTGKHYSINLGLVVSQVINNNDYWTGSAFLSRYNATDYTSLNGWQTVTNQDSNSVSVNPRYKNPKGSSSTLDLHIDTSGTAFSLLESGGIAITGITTDYDNDTRPGPAGSTKGGATKPDMGADEFDGVPRPPCSNTVAGNAVSSTDTICISGSALVSLTGSTGLGVGNGYQWESSSNGTSWFSITGATLPQFTTGTITSTTYYRCIVTCSNGSTSSNSGAKKITVLNPQITSITGGQSCGTGKVVLGAVANPGIARWYSNATGGTPLDTGNTYTTNSLTTTTTFFVEAYINNCVSATRTQVTASIIAVPVITGVGSGSVCGSGPVLLSASANSGSISWYAVSTGGSLLFSGNTYTTPSLTTTTTYYVDVSNAGCTSPSRTPVTATVIPLPTITSSTPGSTCGSGVVVLHATASAGFVNWYSSLTGGSILDTGTTFTTPVIFSTKTYYAEAQSSGCMSSPRTAVVASVVSVPSITGITNGTGCKFDKVVLGATATAGSVNWYAAATGGASLGSGNSFTTPSLTATTTYYVDATNNGCTNTTRIPVTATINPIPTITFVTNALGCGPGSLFLEAIASSGSITWYSDSIAGTLVNTGNTFSTPPLTTTTIYYVEAKSNGCSSTPRTKVTATIKSKPTFTGTTPASSCKPASLIIGATPSAGTVKWYSVSFGGTVLGTGPTFTTPVLSSTATYYAEASDSICISASRAAVDATIYPALDKTTSVSGNTITANASGLTYQWVDCNTGYSFIAGETNKSFTATKNGSYAVILKNTNCTDTSACSVFNKIGFNAITLENDISLYPNPANDYLILKTDGHFTGTKYILMDPIGRVLLSGIISKDIFKINIKELAAGSYILNVGDENRKAFKVIKE